jgi:hypothetical protein
MWPYSVWMSKWEKELDRRRRGYQPMSPTAKPDLSMVWGSKNCSRMLQILRVESWSLIFVLIDLRLVMMCYDSMVTSVVFVTTGFVGSTMPSGRSLTLT